MTTRHTALESALRALVAELDRVLDLDVYHRRVARNDWSRCDQPCRGCEVSAAAEAGRKALAGTGEEPSTLPADPAGRALLERIAEARRDALEEAARVVEGTVEQYVAAMRACNCTDLGDEDMGEECAACGLLAERAMALRLAVEAIRARKERP